MNYYNDFLKEIPKGFSKGLLLKAQDHPPFIFPCISLWKTMRKLLLRAQDHPPFIFLAYPY